MLGPPPPWFLSPVFQAGGLSLKVICRAQHKPLEFAVCGAFGIAFPKGRAQSKPFRHHLCESLRIHNVTTSSRPKSCARWDGDWIAAAPNTFGFPIGRGLEGEIVLRHTVGERGKFSFLLPDWMTIRRI
jgi:hypothetical protein